MPNLRFNDSVAQPWVAGADLIFPIAESDLIRGLIIFARGTVTGTALGAPVACNHFPRGLIRLLTFRTDADNIKTCDALPVSFVGDYFGHRCYLRGGATPAAGASILVEAAYHLRMNPDEMQAAATQRRYSYLAQNRRNVNVVVRCGNNTDLGTDLTFVGTVSVIRDADVIAPSQAAKVIQNLAYRYEDTLTIPIAIGNNRIALSREGFLRNLTLVATEAVPTHGGTIGDLVEAPINNIAINVPRGSRPLSLPYDDACALFRSNAAAFSQYDRDNQIGVAIMPFDEDGMGAGVELIDLYTNQTTLEVNANAACILMVHQEILKKPQTRA